MDRGEEPLARDHGGGVDSAVARWGGARGDWLDLSTGINPVAYPLGDLPDTVWAALPDRAAETALLAAARRAWTVPDGADIVAAPGASLLIALLPTVFSGSAVEIPGPTYNEHAAAFRTHGWTVGPTGGDVRVLVHPNNPDGRRWTSDDAAHAQVVIDESFADTLPGFSLIARAAHGGGVVLKSFGKFWGLAGLRLGFAIGPPDLIGRLRDAMGPWPVSGPALDVGRRALADTGWATETRARLCEDAQRLDALVSRRGATVAGGTPLFRLYRMEHAEALHVRLAEQKILTRRFPYSDSWLRIGLPPPEAWPRLERALAR